MDVLAIREASREQGGVSPPLKPQEGAFGKRSDTHFDKGFLLVYPLCKLKRGGDFIIVPFSSSTNDERPAARLRHAQGTPPCLLISLVMDSLRHDNAVAARRR